MSSGFGSPCESTADSFIESGYDSRACGEGCNPLEQTGACCSPHTRFRGACYDDMPPSKCSSISGYYWGDDTTCLDNDVQCMYPNAANVPCCWQDQNGSWTGYWHPPATCRAVGGTIMGCNRWCPGQYADDGNTAGGCCPAATPLVRGCRYHTPGFCTGIYYGDNIRCDGGAGSMIDVCPDTCRYEGDTPIGPDMTTGACYVIGSTSCTQKTFWECVDETHTFDLAGESCGGVYPGACCFGCGVCVDDMPKPLCELANGTFKGVSSLCSGVSC